MSDLFAYLEFSSLAADLARFEGKLSIAESASVGSTDDVLDEFDDESPTVVERDDNVRNVEQ